MTTGRPMNVRPYPAWGLLILLMTAAAWRLYELPRAKYAVSRERVAGWASLTRMTPEELERGVAHRYAALAPELTGERDVGYFSEKDKSDLWSSALIPAGHDRIERYYMAQSILAPSLLRFDETHPRVVVDCATAEQAERVLAREGLTPVRDFGRGLVLARPGS